MARPKQRIRIFFLNCPRFDWLACSYLLLAQNTKQELFEFEVYHFWTYVLHKSPSLIGWNARLLGRWGTSGLPFRKWAFSRYAAHLDRACAPFLSSTLPAEAMVERIGECLEDHDKWLLELPPSYGGWGIKPAPTIVVTESPLEGGYYGWCDAGLAVISVAGWERRFAPPSVLEFVLRNVQRYSLGLGFGSVIGSHYPTRACTWDFNASLVDIGAGILIGFLCSDCEKGLRAEVGEAEIAGVKRWLSQEWVGQVEETGSVASNIKRIYGYDLARTKGLTRGLTDRMLEVLTSESAKWLVPFVLGLLAARFLGAGGSGTQPHVTTPSSPIL
jgi:hypothetical protein